MVGKVLRRSSPHLGHFDGGDALWAWTFDFLVVEPLRQGSVRLPERRARAHRGFGHRSAEEIPDGNEAEGEATERN